MPMDTREERQSAHGFLLRSFTPGVAPSTIDAPERQAAGYVYAGILADPPLNLVPPFLCTLTLSPRAQAALRMTPQTQMHAAVLVPLVAMPVTTLQVRVDSDMMLEPAVAATFDLDGDIP